jgi:hypothetical protein
MATDHKYNSTNEFFKVASGNSHAITINELIFRKVSFENIKILDDTDYFSHGEFIFHMLVNNKSIGKSRVIYANTGDTLPYKWTLALQHSISQPLIVEFRADELEDKMHNTEVLRLLESFNQSTNFGVGEASLKSYSFSNKYLSIDYSIQKLNRQEFQKLTFIEGKIKSEDDLKPVKNAEIKIFKLSDDKLAKKAKTDDQGSFKIDELDINEKYKLKIISKGYTSYNHLIEEFPCIIEAVVTKLIIKGKAENKSDGSAIKSARVDLYKTVARLTKKLSCYKKPDTKSTKLGTIEEGDYPVLEVKESEETDYLLINTDKFETDVWICSRWQNNYYALPFDKKEKEDITKTSIEGKFTVEVEDEQQYRLRIVKKDFFDGESKRLLPIATETIKMEPAEKAIEESALIKRLSDFKNYSYDLNNAYYPYELPNINIKIAPPNPKTNNCCTFAEGLVVKAWEDSLSSDFVWSKDLHDKMMITASDHYSPVTAILDSHMGIEINSDKLPPPWTYVQGWKAQWSGGHTFLIVDVHTETRRILTLESNQSYKMDGPGFRQLGNIDDFTNCNPGLDWWKEEKLWDWDKFKQEYKYRKMARLKVYDLKWIR